MPWHRRSIQCIMAELDWNLKRCYPSMNAMAVVEKVLGYFCHHLRQIWLVESFSSRRGNLSMRRNGGCVRTRILKHSLTLIRLSSPFLLGSKAFNQTFASRNPFFVGSSALPTGVKALDQTLASKNPFFVGSSSFPNC